MTKTMLRTEKLWNWCHQVAQKAIVGADATKHFILSISVLFPFFPGNSAYEHHLTGRLAVLAGLKRLQ